MTRHPATWRGARCRPGLRYRAASSIRAVKIVCTLALLGAPGCGEDPSDAPPVTPDAAVPHPDASAPPDAPAPLPPPGTIVSNTPGATVVDVGTPATPSLALLSSNLLQDPSGSQVFQQWFGEVKNNGSALVCLLRIDVSFQGAGGAQLASFTSFASADPYMFGTSALTMPCLLPGEVGSFYDNGFAGAAIPLADVKTIAIKLSPNEFPGAVPAPHAPLVSSHVTPVFSGFGVTGTLTGNSGPIYNIALDMYPRDASGLVLAQLSAVDLDTLEPGASFPFTTVSVSSDFTQYRQFADFIDGPAPAAQRTGARPPRSALEDAAAAIDAVRREQRAAVRARAARANGG
jgi:hypothetical protein